MEKKFFVIKQIETREDLYVGVATSNIPDRLGDVVNVKGVLNLEEYLSNPVLLWMHDMREPIGKVVDAKILEDRIEVSFKFASTPKAQEIKQLVDEGVVNALSIGFIPKKTRREGEHLVYDQWLWVETSLVTIPANPQALIVRGIVPDDDASFPLYPNEEKEWDADASEVRWRKYVGVETNEDLQDKEKQRRYAKRFFWADDEKLETFGAYKLPHVDVVDGKPYAIWRGVVAAMAALLGARGGVDIPDEDREKVYNAIAKYYKKADKEPPPLHKNYTQEELEFIAEYGETFETVVARLLRELRKKLVIVGGDAK